jgi:hypothetical protein
MVEPHPEAARPILGRNGTIWSMPAVAGDVYLTVLERFHRILQPQSYLEIGVSTGYTLGLAKCPSIAIDPNIHAETATVLNKRICCLFQMTSDAFFAEYDPRAVLGRPVDMAFLDGMHLYEFLLRDFLNTERFCKKNSIVFLHDCIPPDSYVARRTLDETDGASASRHPEFWTGDVWKTVAILKKHRPDLRIYALDAVPTGLIAITNLDPASNTIAENYYSIVESFREISLNDAGDEYVRSLMIQPSAYFATLENISERFWL